MECGITPVIVSVSPCIVAPRELSTNSEGTISGLAAAAGVPIVFMDAVSASAAPGVDSAAARASIPINWLGVMVFIVSVSFVSNPDNDRRHGRPQKRNLNRRGATGARTGRE